MSRGYRAGTLLLGGSGRWEGKAVSRMPPGEDSSLLHGMGRPVFSVQSVWTPLSWDVWDVCPTRLGA